jgi:hypothetical protein
MALPVVRRNRGTMVSAKLPMDVGSSVTLISKKSDVETVGDDQYMLYVQVDVMNLDSALRFKHSRNGTRKIQVVDHTVSFEMIVESHRTSRKGSVLVELYHKLDGKLYKLAACVLQVEFRSEKGPKDELEFVLRKLSDNNAETPLDAFSNTSSSLKDSSSTSRRETRRSSRHSSPFPKPLNARQRRKLEDMESESDESASDYEEDSSGSESEHSSVESDDENYVPRRSGSKSRPKNKANKALMPTKITTPTYPALNQTFSSTPSFPLFRNPAPDLNEVGPVVPESLPPTAPTSPMSEPVDLNGVEDFLFGDNAAAALLRTGQDQESEYSTFNVDELFND